MGGRMELALSQRAALDYLEAVWRESTADIPSLVPKPDPGKSTCIELDCLRGLISGDIIAAAERRAAEIGVGADRILIYSGVANEEIYVRRLARATGLSFDPLDKDITDIPIDQARLVQSAAIGILSLMIDGELAYVIAPRGLAARRIIELVARDIPLAKRFRLTTEERFRRFVSRHAERAIGDHATNGLHKTWPALSAAPPRWRQSPAPAIITGTLALAALMIAPNPVMITFEVMLAIVFLAWMTLRMAGTLVQWPVQAPPGRIPDDRLPIYTIMVALYREAASVTDLVAALRRLDYPPEKLDIKLIVEPDDAETRAALARLDLGPAFEVIVAPDVGPRTKPKALNVGLPRARGTFTVIYDAEDRPEPDQLRRAFEAFMSGDDNLACVQACLTIDNTADSWLTALFTAEYAGQFDVFLPTLASLRMPLPLGGSSNHFSTTKLRKVGAWDPYNVTEDADLGMRLARFGYASSVIRTTTYEEAPARVAPWLRQRTRWFKGWMQTWLVHMREPRRLLRELGFPAFLTFQLMVGGNVLAALVHPFFIGWFVNALLSKDPVWDTQGAAAFYGFTVLFGYFASAMLAAVGLFRRRLISSAWVLLLIPAHWLLLALAAWRALYQLLCDPYRWEKTEHGLARTSRAAVIQPPYDSNVESLQRTGARQHRAQPTNISATQWPSRRAFAEG
ncbi:MAG: glycosyltransferase [Pseudolabrys sp.]